MLSLDRTSWTLSMRSWCCLPQQFKDLDSSLLALNDSYTNLRTNNCYGNFAVYLNNIFPENQICRQHNTALESIITPTATEFFDSVYELNFNFILTGSSTHSLICARPFWEKRSHLQRFFFHLSHIVSHSLWLIPVRAVKSDLCFVLARLSVWRFQSKKS